MDRKTKLSSDEIMREIVGRQDRRQAQPGDHDAGGAVGARQEGGHGRGGEADGREVGDGAQGQEDREGLVLEGTDFTLPLHARRRRLPTLRFDDGEPDDRVGAPLLAARLL